MKYEMLCNSELFEKNIDVLDFVILQPFTKYFPCEIAHYQKSLISVFQQFFASINKIFILAERLGTRLSFYEVETLS